MTTAPTTLSGLKQFLIEACYQPSIYHIGPSWSGCGDTYCIEQIGSRFEIFYVERGCRSYAISIHEDEGKACSEFIQKLDQEKWSKAHCVAFVTEEELVQKIAARIEAEGASTERNDIPAFNAPAIQGLDFLCSEEIKRSRTT